MLKIIFNPLDIKKISYMCFSSVELNSKKALHVYTVYNEVRPLNLSIRRMPKTNFVYNKVRPLKLYRPGGSFGRRSKGSLRLKQGIIGKKKEFFL
jgi:hypothetical protein